MIKQKRGNCPVCGNNTFYFAHFCEDFLLSHEKFPVFVCTECYFHFTRDIPSVDEMGRYYRSKDYISHTNAKKGIVDFLYHCVRKCMLRQKARMIERYYSRRTLLDVGCGTGHFASTMQRRGWKVVGVEPSDEVAAFARERFKLQVKSSLYERSLPANVDVITLWHVLEHLPNLDEAMEQINSLLRCGGLLVVAAPNLLSYDARKYKEYWAAFDVPRHLWHFSPDTFYKLVLSYGFTLLRMRTMPFDAFYISILSERNKKSRFPVLRGILTGVRGYLRSLSDKRESSSLIYILRKTDEIQPIFKL
jgi:2-polyprenyl-3-methyl-5-hydroxy-6-metoxy-1,4-benzoquinol methylase